jgi:hypothetical protein
VPEVEALRLSALGIAAIRFATLSATNSVPSLPRPTPVGPTTRAARWLMYRLTHPNDRLALPESPPRSPRCPGLLVD